MPICSRSVDLDVEAQIVKVAEFIGEEDVELAGAGREAVARDIGDGSGSGIAIAGFLRIRRSPASGVDSGAGAAQAETVSVATTSAAIPKPRRFRGVRGVIT